MRWITYLESNEEAYATFKQSIESKIEHHRQYLEDCRQEHGQIRFHQGCISTLRQILLELEESQKESREHAYRAEQSRAAPG